METIARNEYMAGDSRDPTACSLFYFALGKVKLVHGLWRQAAWHKEQPIMLKFLANDFTQPRWRTAALKNAYALLGKQRFGEHIGCYSQRAGLKLIFRVCCGIFPAWGELEGRCARLHKAARRLPTRHRLGASDGARQRWSCVTRHSE